MNHQIVDGRHLNNKQIIEDNMGCNCKKGTKRVVNNLDNVDYINIAQDVYNRVISSGDISTYTELDIVEIMGAYASLYPNSSSTPSLEEAINQIKIGIELYNVKYRRK